MGGAPLTRRYLLSCLANGEWLIDKGEWWGAPFTLRNSPGLRIAGRLPERLLVEFFELSRWQAEGLVAQEVGEAVAESGGPVEVAGAQVGQLHVLHLLHGETSWDHRALEETWC